MKTIVTGSSGTVGTALCRRLRNSGHSVLQWDRSAVPVDDDAAAERFIAESGADWLFHLAVASNPTGLENEGWIVNQKWTENLARLCRENRVSFVFTSTVMVYTDDAKGPFTPETVPDAAEGYGHGKLLAERDAMRANPDAHIARLGWQIADGPGSNNMVDNLENQMRENGVIQASTKWLPATSHVDDTADALIAIASLPGGVYLVNSNQRWNFHDIVCALNRVHGNQWTVQPNEDFVYDQRMLDDRVPVRSLEERFQPDALPGV